MGRMASDAQVAANRKPLPGAQIRAAFDIGSGATKMQVFERSRDLSGSASARVLASRQVSILYSHALCADGPGRVRIGNSTLAAGFEAVRKLRDLALSLGCARENVRGVATAVFRRATNGPAFLARMRRELGVSVRVVSQAVEARLGFSAGVSAGGASKAALVWDLGNSSFQICAKSGSLTFGVPVGAATARDMMLRAQRKIVGPLVSENPVSLGDRKSLEASLRHLVRVEARRCSWLVEHLRTDPQVVCIGGRTSAFRLCSLAVGAREFSLEGLRGVLPRFDKCSDKDLDKHFPGFLMVVPKLVLVVAVMAELGLQSAVYTPTVGLTRGVALDDEFWASVSGQGMSSGSSSATKSTRDAKSSI